ncbi:M1 family aminopeptidase [Fulvivirgaceae bacterium BMA10]|uniref:M1 family aminopeptidase n=1 Tax=Splendidivirga corallicola TaxID=3051826 RepID=A0ABT8KZE1_9BACT|nr:M1 family aminopeptidase [Fulvivirgaceae bacterium BMA10]
MLFEIFKFEIKYRAKRPDTYIYFVALFLYSIVAVDFLFEGELDPLKRNAPIVIARTMGIVSALFMMITSMIMGVSVLRDFDHQMESLMFINPIKKRDYLLGRFLGSFAVLIFIFSGLLFGMVLGDLMPWLDPDKMLPFNFWHYLQPFLYLILPTLFFGGAIFFVSGALSRKLIVVYTQGFFFLVVYLLAINLARNSDDLFLTALLEPFTFQTVRITTQFWTVVERNSLMLPMDGVLLYNRLTWMAVGIIALVIGHYGFSFHVIKGKALKKQLKASSHDQNIAIQHSNSIQIPTFNVHYSILANIRQLMQQALFTFKSIIKEVPFWTIVLCGIGILLISSFNLGTFFGVDSYPTTYILVGELVELTIIFFLSIIVFYSGELVWKERDVKVSGIHDALPISDFTNLAGKFIGLVLTYAILILAMILAGIIFQTSKGYYHYELDVYFTGFFVEVFPFLFLLAILCFFIQSLVNHKFIGHLVVVIFIFSATILLKVLGLDHGLYTFGGADLGRYSDMNGYGHFIEPYLWFKVYWIAISIVLFIIAIIFSIRGTETRFITRWKLSKPRLNRSLLRLGVVVVIIFTLSGCYIFYNTNILNGYATQATQNAYRADYEKKLKHFEYLPQPKIVDVNLTLELYPYERDYSVEGYYVLTNTHSMPIDEIHIQKLPNDQVALEYLNFDRGARFNNEYEEYGYKIFEFNKALQPGDSVKVAFKQTYTTTGFTESSNTHIVYNGTFFDNFHFPTLGYLEDIALEDDDVRKEHGLNPKIRRAKIDDPIAVLSGRSDGDGEEINFEMIIGTDSGQIAIAPGYLQKEWVEGDRKYFHYKMDKPMSNFYSVVSARYEVMRDQWTPAHDSLGNPVNLEIYYHRGHEYNLDRMMKGMKKSLDYFSKHFSPYQYRQMRILETPGYKERAQSFPNTVPFSESLGFILDIDDEHDVDMAFYVTAHEMAHQWWGHQVNPANVQGMSMLSETLAQYSALMVLKQESSEEKIRRFLKTQMNRYLKGRSRERIREMPLALVESGQQYIHYDKGLLNLNAFQDYVSEDSVNIALRRFIRDWDSFHGRKKRKTDRYPTTKDLMGYFRDVTPDSLQYVIEDLFETITLYEFKTTEAIYEKYSKDQYEVNMTLEAMKYRADSNGLESSIGVNDWVDIGIYAEGGNGKDELIYLEKHKITDEVTSLEIVVDQKPTKAGIDPLNKLIDRNTDDNIQTVSEKE